MSSLFQNVTQSKQYAAFRPTYPTAVYRRIVQALEKTKHGGLGVDVGCGSGQATLGLARAVAASSTTTASANSNPNTTSSPHPVLERIIGIDPSPAQVQQARHKLETSFLQVDKEISQDGTTTRLLPSVEFHPGHDHDIVKTLQGLHLHLHLHPHHSVTCIIAAQAAHWFNLPAFYQQVDQLLVPGGVLALWTYGNLQLHTEKDAPNAVVVQELQHKIMVELYEQILGDAYWDPRRHHAESLYRELPQIQTVLRCNNKYTTEYITSNANNPDPDFFIRQTMTRPQLMGYLRSWSGYISYLQHHQISSGSTDDPVAKIDTWIANAQCATGTPALPDAFQVEWPIAMLLSIKQ
mmetsp:Transcript_33361/g.80733  ORF Transcript_33361/g.80733 Transcript_33361/m.80733 type:complete len:351 (-) Transcript_33361:130-1182(-)|eukprot:CAMPEP_0113500844 /NCGR_PEP_ID=MMETSP0014_2-20120614/32585_1 /TAXON_ID=2857 /ORGANISM="Nitzschia sp." /LENGTH=350 /DNA_ID=CAMNT_0000395287 /DNA_START=159 /DNA_END=1211 /DNA_ORIENTATION=+ /assembly_acc=CAM_ASM_000159